MKLLLEYHDRLLGIHRLDLDVLLALLIEFSLRELFDDASLVDDDEISCCVIEFFEDVAGDEL